ncbi:NAD-dependent epimerase/dehydratase family protein [Bordetella hinzii]|uniref:NAD-dependent epimerase/dehydratase family protein n=1 Tax=Bordetella hinzii TaxID=103855 RepID=UPI0011523EA7|nr:NAD-dependent epimerase/dehydratase family protein [Bordetella hinzii]QDJ48496.1 capsular biosynthesis protein [Bordetella hinzii]QII84774.1 NAD-dependent epimerase/dehydratase family protein [Bordetella hinzii]WPL80044.1 NAD-dependent epimerase/dehydratase family protein [Bordetella hinzii]
MKQRILVLGANGYVGRRVMAQLAASDWAEPVAGVRRARGQGREIVLDATDAASVARALGEADAAVNCVAGPAETMTAGARALASALDAKPAPLVHFSSMAVYGPAQGDIGEDHPLAQGMEGYAGAKVEAERLLSSRPAVVTLRPGCIYGPQSPQWSLRIASLLRARRIGDLGAAGDGCSNLVYIDDVVAAVLAGLRAPAGVYNLAMAQAPDWNAYFLAYARALGAVPLKRIGERRLKVETHLLAPALKIAEIGLGRMGLRVPPPIPPSLARLWRQPIRLLSERAERELGLRWTPLQEGLAATVAADRA